MKPLMPKACDLCSFLEFLMDIEGDNDFARQRFVGRGECDGEMKVQKTRIVDQILANDMLELFVSELHLGGDSDNEADGREKDCGLGLQNNDKGFGLMEAGPNRAARERSPVELGKLEVYNTGDPLPVSLEPDFLYLPNPSERVAADKNKREEEEAEDLLGGGKRDGRKTR